MTHIYAGFMKPIIKIHCGCGCNEYILISRFKLKDDAEPEYVWDFKDPNFWPLGYRIRQALTPKKKYMPLGIILKRDQYPDLRAALELELGDIPPKEFEFKLDADNDNYTLAEIGDKYASLTLSSFDRRLDDPGARAGISICPVKPSKPPYSYILSPTFQASDEIITDRDDLIKLAQVLRFYWEV